MQSKSQNDVQQDKNSQENETSDPQQKQEPGSGNDASKTEEASPSAKQDAHDLQKRKSSDPGIDDLKFHEEEPTVPSNNVMDSDLPTTKQISRPRIPSGGSDPPMAIIAHVIKYKKALEELQPRRNLDSGDHSFHSEQGSKPSRIPEDVSKIQKDKPDCLGVKQRPDSGVHCETKKDSEKTCGNMEVVSDNMQPVQSLGGASASQSDKQKLACSTRPSKAVKKLHPRRNPETGGSSLLSNQAILPSGIPGKLSTTLKKREPENLNSAQCLYSGGHASLKKEEKCASTDGQKDSGHSPQVSSLSIRTPISQSDQENFSYAKKVEKVEKLQPRRNPDPVAHGSQTAAESTPSKLSEKGSDEGYNWRKYGQKLVKGNEFIRSYYRCTYPSCQAKKQVERSHDGCQTDVKYFGNHQHPKPQHGPQLASAFRDQVPQKPISSLAKSNAEPINGEGSVNLALVPIEASCQHKVARSGDSEAGAVSCSVNDNNKDGHPNAKRQKTETSLDDKTNSDLRHVVQTLSEVDIVNDGYRWRKYGQKLVKGNPNPRSYYRCSNAGCPVKKHVERASHDPKVVITTYEGHHVHDMPLSRIANQSTTADDANVTDANDEPRSKPQEKDSISLEMVAHVSAN